MMSEQLRRLAFGLARWAMGMELVKKSPRSFPIFFVKIRMTSSICFNPSSARGPDWRSVSLEQERNPFTIFVVVTETEILLRSPELSGQCSFCGYMTR